VQEILSDIVTENRRTIDVLERLRSLFTRDGVRAGAAAVNASVSDALLLERSTLRSRGVTTQLDLADDLPLAGIERVELQQVLINLIVNACDAMEENAAGDRKISIRTRAQDDGVAIEVADNGSGLADTESIFGTFFTTKPEGLGLGLAICRAIVTARGGKLTARNNATAGATFRVWLPAYGLPTQGRRSAYAAAPEAHRENGHASADEQDHLMVPEHVMNARATRPGSAHSAHGPHA
jgi:two-component system, LuxR family, sensor kinase FixL